MPSLCSESIPHPEDFPVKQTHWFYVEWTLWAFPNLVKNSSFEKLKKKKRAWQSIRKGCLFKGRTKIILESWKKETRNFTEETEGKVIGFFEKECLLYSPPLLSTDKIGAQGRKRALPFELIYKPQNGTFWWI